MKLQEYKEIIIQQYDEYIYYKEKRGISYGEILYIYNLTKKELQQLEAEIQENYSKELKD